MKKYFTISEAAKTVHTTSETLRHYDRIGLVKPSKKNEWTNYRYYSAEDIVRLNTVRALQQMDLPLQEIKQILEYDDLERIIDFLKKAEKQADEKIAALARSKEKIQAARFSYEDKVYARQAAEDIFVKYFPKRVIMLSDILETPTLDNLWNYLKHYYDKIDPSIRDQFAFEDLAGIYTEKDRARLFAVCIRYAEIDGLKVLPAGNYLCAGCSEVDRERVLDMVIQKAKKEYDVVPRFIVQQIVISGILQWNYQIQIYLENASL